MALLSETPLAIASPPDHFNINIAPLDLAEAYTLAEAPENGAVVVMSGTVRSQTEGRAVEALDYQAYAHGLGGVQGHCRSDSPALARREPGGDSASGGSVAHW